MVVIDYIMWNKAIHIHAPGEKHLMSRKLNISLAQLNWLVGDIEGNCERMLQVVSEQAPNTDIVMFSELSLTGYPPEDLIFVAILKIVASHS